MPADRSKRITTTTALTSDLIQSFTSDGFVIGTHNDVNRSGRRYDWIAMKAGPNVAIGTYTGDGTDNRNITSIAFQPDWVVTLADGEEDQFRPALLAGDAAFKMGGNSTFTDRIQSILANGFQIGANSEVNQSGRAYYWIAFDATSKVVTGTYAGDGNDDRNINGIGITPSFVWVKRASNNQSSWRTNSMAGDISAYWDATDPNPNRIQSLFSGGFQVGDNAQVNSGTNSPTYYYLALAP
jgi:ribulose bisphosphate carboxylase small subunit